MAGEGTGVQWTEPGGEEHELPSDVTVRFATGHGHELAVSFHANGSVKVVIEDGSGLKMKSETGSEWVIDGATWW